MRFVLEIDFDGLANVFQGGFDGFALGHASGQLRNVHNVAIVFRIENKVD